MQDDTVSITLWGDIGKVGRWYEWFEDVKKIFALLGYSITHIGVRSSEKPSKKIVSAEKKEEEILKSLKSGFMPQAISCYALPKEYKSASFDYELLVVRNEEYVSVIMNCFNYSVEQGEIIKNILSQYIKEYKGQIYKMSKQEVPLIYAADVTNNTAYNSLFVMEYFQNH